MHEPPEGVIDDDLRAAVRAAWAVEADVAAYLPVGFGAHHWRVGPLFVTLDALDGRHDATTLHAAYAGAAALADDGLELVVASVQSWSGTYTVPFAGGALSATRWLEGSRPTDAADALPLVRRLHAVDPPSGLPHWQPVVAESYAEELARRLRSPWAGGPHAPTAHAALTEHLGDIASWTADYHRLADLAHNRPWVTTHGEPHERNQLVTTAGLRLVDWESLTLAPPERDLRHLDAAGADAEMVAMFELEWRLDGIAQYAGWFEEPHGDGADDRMAITGLLAELAGPGARQPSGEAPEGRAG